ncbi:MAG: alginate export family protein [Flavobacteriales bacterium]
MKTKQITLAALAMLSFNSFAQLSIDGEFRPRTEYRHGFKQLATDDADAAFFTSQRTRLNAGYKTEKYDFHLSFQDTRIWGDAGQLNENPFSLSIHQAWSNIHLSKKFDLKLGRQEIAYDDQRIFGNVGWAQQARSHDAAIVKYKNDGLNMDLGLAFNQNQAGLEGTNYQIGNNYKSLQYLRVNKAWDNFEGSVLVLNNGLQNLTNSPEEDYETFYSQTIGTHFKYKLNESLKFTGNVYFQTGKDRADRDVSAHLFGLEASYKEKDSKLNYGLGFEMQSGNAYDENTKNNAFTPFYGTNHKFNGLMDYFYVGNHGNSVGLVDLYGKIGFKLKDKSQITAMAHYFTSAEDINADGDRDLGTEIDLVYSHKLNADVTIKAGYSHMLASDGLAALRGGNADNTNNWGWLMLVVKPKLFTSK